MELCRVQRCCIFPVLATADFLHWIGFLLAGWREQWQEFGGFRWCSAKRDTSHVQRDVKILSRGPGFCSHEYRKISKGFLAHQPPSTPGNLSSIKKSLHLEILSSAKRTPSSYVWPPFVGVFGHPNSKRIPKRSQCWLNIYHTWGCTLVLTKMWNYALAYLPKGTEFPHWPIPFPFQQFLSFCGTAIGVLQSELLTSILLT